MSASRRFIKVYVVNLEGDEIGAVRLMGIRYDRKKREVMVCGPTCFERVMRKCLLSLSNRGAYKRTNPNPYRVRLIGVGVIEEDFKKRLDEFLDDNGLEFETTTSFRRTCR